MWQVSTAVLGLVWLVVSVVTLVDETVARYLRSALLLLLLRPKDCFSEVEPIQIPRLIDREFVEHLYCAGSMLVGEGLLIAVPIRLLVPPMVPWRLRLQVAVPALVLVLRLLLQHSPRWILEAQ